MNIILWFFDSIQFVGAMFEHYPSPFWAHPICNGHWLALQPRQNGQDWRDEKHKIDTQNRYRGGVLLQYGITQGQNFAQNGSQKPFIAFCNKNFNGDIQSYIIRP